MGEVLAFTPCPRFFDLLLHTEEDLPARRAAALQRHVRCCARCGERLLDHELILELVRAASLDERRDTFETHDLVATHDTRGGAHRLSPDSTPDAVDTDDSPGTRDRHDMHDASREAHRRARFEQRLARLSHARGPATLDSLVRMPTAFDPIAPLRPALRLVPPPDRPTPNTSAAPPDSRRWLAAAVLIALLLGGDVVGIPSTRIVQADTLLTRAIAHEQTRPPGWARHVDVHFTAHGSLRARTMPMSDGAPIGDDTVRPLLVLHRFDARDPLDARQFAAWRHSLPARWDDVKAINREVVLHTTNGAPFAIGVLREGWLFVERDTYRAVRTVLAFDGIGRLDVAEAVPVVQRVDPQPAPQPAPRPPAALGSTPEPPDADTLQEAELDVRLALARAGLDLRGAITLTIVDDLIVDVDSRPCPRRQPRPDARTTRTDCSSMASWIRSARTFVWPREPCCATPPPLSSSSAPSPSASRSTPSSSA